MPTDVGERSELVFWFRQQFRESHGPENGRTDPNASIAEWLRGLGIAERPRQTTINLLLPTSVLPRDDRPIAAATTHGSRSATLELAPPALKHVRQSGLGFPLGLAAIPLARMNASNGSTIDENIEIGADLRFWSSIALWALTLLRAGQVVPGIERRFDGELQAVWRPVLTSLEERRRLRAFTAATPPIARAAVPEGMPDYPMVPADELVGGFLNATIDVLARHWLSSDQWPDERWQLDQSIPPAPARWLSGLAAVRPLGSRLLSHRIVGLPAQIDDWTSPVAPGRMSPFRAAFRLSPPHSEPVDPTTDPTNVLLDQESPNGTVPPPRPPVPGTFAADSYSSTAIWRLDYFLQATDDGSLLIPASQVWQTGAAVARLAGRLVVEPQEALLADLARAGSAFPPIASGLAESHPIGVDLSTKQAYEFLRSGAPAIEGDGMGVLVPAWWSKRGSTRRLSVRVRLTPSHEGSGIFGREALVDFNWQIALGDEVLSVEEFQQLAEMKMPLVQVRGEWVAFQPEEVERALHFWRDQAPAGSMPISTALRMALATEQGESSTVAIQAEGWLKDVLDGSVAFHDDLGEPPGFFGELRPYQRRGFAWLTFLRQHGMGACLADDMGLGKTVMMIAALVHERAVEGLTGPTLLVCPTSVLGNWLHELNRFAPGLRVYTHHGPERNLGITFPERIAEHDVVLTTYAIVSRDVALLMAVHWTGIVLDEAQNIKNPATSASRIVRKLTAGYRVALTGTPVENRLAELWSILEFLNPGYLGSHDGFRRHFAQPIERSGDTERAEELRRLVAPFILRRVKSDPTVIQDLPEKFEQTTYTTLTREQATLYEAVVRDMLEQIDTAEGLSRRGLILAALTRLKQVCNHPAQFLADGSAMANRSGKLSRLEEMLEEAIGGGDHALIFTQYAEFGGRLTTYLKKRLDCEVLFLFGGTPAIERDRMVQRFQSATGPPVFVLSLRAGGIGLNLTRANRVFHFDRWWNPAVENQATDRAYRIGQTRAVQVHRFVTSGTLEERIDELIESKRALANAVIGEGEGWLTELSTDELRSILSLRNAVIVEN